MTQVSVVIPSALRATPGTSELWLERAVRSVQGQTLRPAEVVVGLDPGAALPDGLALSLPVRVANGDVKGHQAACNAGVKAAASPLVAFLEDDDEWRQNHLEVVTRALAERGLDFVTMSQEEFDESGGMRPFDFPTPSSWLFSRVAWFRAGGFDTRFRVHHDNAMLAQMRLSGARRLHIVEDGADLGRPGPNGTAWLLAVREFAPVAAVAGMKELTVRRRVHADSIMGQVGQGGERARRSEIEYAALEVLYGCVPW